MNFIIHKIVRVLFKIFEPTPLDFLCCIFDSVSSVFALIGFPKRKF